MSRFLFAAFAFVVLFSVATAQQCGDNEAYRLCGSACPPTCGDLGLQACTANCVQGCFCKVGLLRNSKGKCVPPIACVCDVLDA